jgi:hypothetical protein
MQKSINQSTNQQIKNTDKQTHHGAPYTPVRHHNAQVAMPPPNSFANSGGYVHLVI